MSAVAFRSAESGSFGRSFRLCVAAALAACGCAAGGDGDRAGELAAAGGVVAALAVGPSGVSYAGVGLEDHEAWGPSALRAADDGTFWIADTAADRLVHIDAGGKVAGTIAIGDQVTGARDLLVRESDLFVLDGSAMWPHVVRYALSGEVLADIAIPTAIESSVDGFLPSADGRVLLHGGGVAVFELKDGAVSDALQRYALRDQAFGLDFPDANGDDIGHVLDIDTGRGATHLNYEHFVSSVRLLRVLPNGESFFALEEVTFDPRVLVDATALHLDAEGNVLGRARLPVAGQFVFVDHAASVDDEGRLYALHTDAAGAQIARLEWRDALEPVLEQRIAVAREDATADDELETGEPMLPAIDGGAGVGATAQALTTECRTTQMMMDKGFQYVNSATWLSKANMDRAKSKCDGRGVPRYFKDPKTSLMINGTATCEGDAPGKNYECIRSVPYDWGGADTVKTYRQAMDKGLQSGDIDTKNPVAENAGNTGIESCSHGADCSGFVTRAWNISDYYDVSRATTRSLAKYSTSLSNDMKSHPGCVLGKKMPNAKPPQAPEITTGCKNGKVKIQSGDILLKAGTHVTMFRKFGDTKDKNVDGDDASGKFPFHFESTQKNSLDRVSYFYWPWSRFDSYEPRRFKQVCP